MGFLRPCPRNYIWFQELLSITRLFHIVMLVAYKYSAPFNQQHSKKNHQFDHVTRELHLKLSFSGNCVNKIFLSSKFPIHVFELYLFVWAALKYKIVFTITFLYLLYEHDASRNVSNEKKNTKIERNNWHPPKSIQYFKYCYGCLRWQSLSGCVWPVSAYPELLGHVRFDFLFKIIEKWKFTITFIAHCEQCYTDIPFVRIGQWQWQWPSRDFCHQPITITVSCEIECVVTPLLSFCLFVVNRCSTIRTRAPDIHNVNFTIEFRNLYGLALSYESVVRYNMERIMTFFHIDGAPCIIKRASLYAASIYI